MRLDYLVEQSQSQFEMLIELYEKKELVNHLMKTQGRSDSDVEKRETQDDESLEGRRREDQGDEDHDVGFEGDYHQGSGRSLGQEENIEMTEEAKQASFSIQR